MIDQVFIKDPKSVDKNSILKPDAEWVEKPNRYQCSNCNYATDIRYSVCPWCKRIMRNGNR